jgi:quinoprotein glucose dehydrogenase
MTRSRLTVWQNALAAFRCVGLSLLTIFVLLLVFPVSRSAQTLNGEWRAYAGDVRATKYSPLDQINRDNVGRLRIAWRQSAVPVELREGRPGVNVPSNYEHTPLMAGGRLFVSTALGSVAALDPATGRVVWTEAREAGVQGQGAGASRGLAYWSDGKDARVVSVSGRFLVALDAKTGKPYAGFGEGGRVDLARGYDRPVQGFRWGGPPLVVRDVIVIGGVPAPATDYLNEGVRAVKEAPPGDVRGFDVRTGRLLWTFHVVPRRGEFGYDTWQSASAEYTGNSGAWSWMSADEELGYVYVPGEDATGDFYGGTRPGNNLFADTLVCLDAKTGKRIWHFQAIHHPLWDYDLPAAPVLADVTVNGRRRKIAAQVSKQAFTYVLDRETGEPIWPIVERPVPKGDTPGEWYAPTQPVPSRPPAFDLQGITTNDLIDFTPELRKQAVDIVSKYRSGPLFTPVSPNQGTILQPGTVGGANWNGAAIDPETGILYVPSIRLPVVVDLVTPKNPESNLPYVRRASGLDTNLELPNGLPIVKPPYGSVTAIDLNKGDILWRVANGPGPRDHPALKALNLPSLGTIGRPSPLVTKTLLFIGEGMGRGAPRIPAGGGGKMFRAYDKQTGKVVWEMELPGGTTGAPMTYSVNGTQFIVVAVGWEGMPAELVALSLP